MWQRWQAEPQFFANRFEVLVEVLHAADEFDDLFVLAVNQIVLLKLNVPVTTPSQIVFKPVKALEQFVLIVAVVFKNVVVQRNLPRPRISDKAKRKVLIKNLRSDRFANRLSGGVLVGEW